MMAAPITQRVPFDPSNDPRTFRAALGSFVTGVTVVTAETAQGPVAIVANSFASLSLDPPLVLWSPAKASSRFADFANAQAFSIHVLAAGHRQVCDQILASKFAIADVPTLVSECGMTIIEGSVAAFECVQEVSHDGGDHAIVVGRVHKALHQGGAPLAYHAGNFAHVVPLGA